MGKKKDIEMVVCAGCQHQIRKEDTKRVVFVSPTPYSNTWVARYGYNCAPRYDLKVETTVFDYDKPLEYGFIGYQSHIEAKTYRIIQTVDVYEDGKTHLEKLYVEIDNEGR